MSIAEEVMKRSQKATLLRAKTDIAYHEAAHAVAFIRGGINISLLQLGGAEAWWYALSSEAEGWVTLEDELDQGTDLRAIEHMAVAYLAGYSIELERGISGIVAATTARDDFASVEKLIPDRKRWGSLFLRAATFVRTERAVIDAVATELESAGLLMREQVEQIVYCVDWNNSG